MSASVVFCDHSAFSKGDDSEVTRLHSAPRHRPPGAPSPCGVVCVINVSEGRCPGAAKAQEHDAAPG